MTESPDPALPPPLTKQQIEDLKRRERKADITNSEIIAMAWDDETSFDAIERITGMPEAEVIALMRAEMKPSSFRMWRKRVTGRKAKHDAL